MIKVQFNRLSVLIATTVLFIGCGSGASTTLSVPQETTVFSSISAMPVDLPLVDASGVSFVPSRSALDYADLEAPYIVLPVSNDQAFMDLHVYNFVSKEMINYSFSDYDPFLAKIDQGRIFLVFNPAGTNIQMNPISMYDIETGQMTDIAIPFYLQPLGKFDVSGSALAVFNAQEKMVKIYDISNLSEPVVTATLPVQGTMQQLKMIKDTLFWTEHTNVGGFMQTTTYQYSLVTKTTTQWSNNYSVVSQILSDGKYVSYYASTGSCNVGLKDSANAANTKPTISDFQTTCSQDKLVSEYVIADLNGSVIKRIPIEDKHYINATSLANGVLAWSYTNDITKARSIRLYNILTDRFAQYASPDKGISFDYPFIANGQLIYVASPIATFPMYQEKMQSLLLPPF